MTLSTFLAQYPPQHRAECELFIASGRLAREAQWGAYWYKQPNRKVVKLWDHVCGMAGFGAIGDTCPACEQRGKPDEYGPDCVCTCGLDDALADLRLRAQQKEQEEKDQVTRVDHTQYDQPLATASENRLVPTVTRNCPKCGASFVELEGLFGADRTLPVVFDCPPCGAELVASMHVTVELHQAGDAVDPHGDSNTGKPSTREVNSSALLIGGEAGAK